MAALDGSSSSSESFLLPAPIRRLLQDGPLTPSAAIAAAASMPSSRPVNPEMDILQAIQQTSAYLQARPDALPSIRSQLTSLLEIEAPYGASTLVPLWKAAFECKASEPAGFSQDEAVQTKVLLAIASVRMLRNLVAGDQEMQQVLFDRISGQVLQLLRLASSLAFAGDPELQPLVRSLVQLLSNMVTANKPLQKALFHKLRLSSSPHVQVAEALERITVLQNLLGSPDTGTVEAVQILLLNCIKSSATNSTALAISVGGRRLLGQLLQLFEATIEDEDGSRDQNGIAAGQEEDFEDDDSDDEDHGELDDFGVGDLDITEGEGPMPIKTAPRKTKTGKRSAKAHKPPLAAAPNGSLQVTVGYAIFAHLFSIGLFRHLYKNLAPLPAQEHDDPTSIDLVTTEQTLLLKTVDAWINAGAQEHTMNDLSTTNQFKRLPNEFVRLSRFIRSALQQASKTGTPDRRLIGAHQAIVLVLENLIQLGMIGCEGLENDEQFREESEEILRRMRRAPVAAESTNGDGGMAPNAKIADEQLDVLKEILELLTATSEFSPPISPFKSAGTSATFSELPEGHAYTSTGLSSSTPSSSNSDIRLDHLNRTLIQLLGVLVFQHSPTSLPQSFQERSLLENEEEFKMVRTVQDRVRELGGLLKVVGMTRLDERNPYIREHAIFTLRYLLQGNLENQDVIAQLQPVQ